MVSIFFIATATAAVDVSHYREMAADNGFVSLSLTKDQVQHTEAQFSRHNRRLDEKTVDQKEAPLFIGTGTHYANLFIGSPAQRVSVIIDTGSHHTAFPCSECKDCGTHTDPYFKPKLSHTSRTLTCSDCPQQRFRYDRGLGQCDSKADRCRFSQSYAEGSSWNAFQLRDKVWLGRHEQQENAISHNALASTDFKFGCINKQTGMFNGQVSNGIMGFGRSEATLVSALYKSKVVETKVFSLCFAKDGGSLTIGAPESDKRLRSNGKPVRWVPLLPSRSNWYVVSVTDVRVGGERMQGGVQSFKSGKGTIVDSGTTDTYLPKAVASEFASAFKAASGLEFQGGKQYRLSKNQVDALPSVYFDLNGGEDQGGATVEMKASQYMSEGGAGVYRLRLYTSEGDGAILGANAMQDKDVIFDEGNNRMGWVEANCHTPELKATPAPTPAPMIVTSSTATMAEAVVAEASAAQASVGALTETTGAPVGVIAAVVLVLVLVSVAVGYTLGKRSSPSSTYAPTTNAAVTNAEEYGISTSTLARSDNMLSAL